MMKPGNRGTCVDINPSRQDGYDRIRPQGGRGFRALQSLGIEYRRKSGKRDVGAGDLSERRGGASGANAFLESSPSSRTFWKHSARILELLPFQLRAQEGAATVTRGMPAGVWPVPSNAVQRTSQRLRRA